VLQAKTYPPSGAGLMVITRRELKARLRRVFWKAVKASRPEPLSFAETERLKGTFEAHWKVEQ
jgi:hypothetical protein